MFKTARCLATFSLLILILPLPSGAEEESLAKSDSSDASLYFLRGTVVSAGRYEQQPFTISQPVAVFSRQEIQSQSPAIISDLFRDVPGVEANDAGPFRTRPVIRGMFGSRVLILVDGERLNNTRESTFSGAQLSLVDIGQVERVETIYGPGSVLYGSDALGGVVNIITKKPRDISSANPFEYYGKLQLRYSTVDEQKKGRLEFGGRYEKFSFLAGGSLREASDYRIPEATVVNSALGEESSLDLKADYQLADKHNLSFDYQRFRAKDIGYPGTPDPARFPFKFTFPYHDRDKAVVKWEGRNLTSRLAKLEAKLHYQKFSKEFDSEMDLTVGPMHIYSFSRTLTDVEIYGASFQELFLTAPGQHLTWGVDYYREVIEGSRWKRDRTEIAGGPPPSDDTTMFSTVPENHQDIVGVFLNNQLNLSDAATLTLGVRYDYFRTETERTPDYVDTRVDPPQPYEPKSQSLGSLNGGLGLVYSLTPRINLVANLASGYRAPNVVEKYFSGQASGNEFVIPNYDLEPEKSYNLDVGAKFNFKKGYASLTLFQNNYRDYIELESTGDTVRIGHESYPEWHYTNITELRISGVEGVLLGDLPNGFHGSVSFAYNYGENITTDQPFFVAPFKAVFSFGWKDSDGRFGGESNLRFVNNQDRVPKGEFGYRDNLPTESFTVVNLEAFVKPFEWQTLNFGVRNVFDETYAEPYNATNPDNPVNEPGRNFIISATTTF